MSDTNYGSAANGMTYNGLTVGSGWDCTIRRESETTAIANFMTPNRQRDVLVEIEVEAEQDLQALAVSYASHPAGPHAFEFDAVSDGDDRWDDLADRWNRLVED